jgi:hypothetical protein
VLTDAMSVEQQLARERGEIRSSYNVTQYLSERDGKMPARADYLDGWETGGNNVVPIHRPGGAA